MTCSAIRLRWLNRLLPQLVGVRAHLLPIVTLDLNTGLREMELLTLKPEHIDFHRDVIHVKGTKSDEDREVPINGTARKLLTELVGVAKQKDHEYLFTNPKTNRHHACIKNAWNTACRKAGITNLRFHDLRHTFGTRAVVNGASIDRDNDAVRSCYRRRKEARGRSGGKDAETGRVWFSGHNSVTK